jgi:hypothetical protein
LTDRRREAAFLKLAFVIVLAIALVAPLPFVASTVSSSPSFQIFPSPPSAHADVGEPSIGADWRTGAAMFQSYLVTDRVTFNDAASPPTASWQDVSAFVTSRTSYDAILWTDSATGRTVVSQLAPGFAVGLCSIQAYTPDDGATWVQANVGCGIPFGVDHQSVGGGPYPAPLLNPAYQDQVYFCSQALIDAYCARSDDGALSYGLGSSVFLLSPASCIALHGHVKVGPDGAVYLPDMDCDGHPAVAVSQDLGLTWTIQEVLDGGTQDESDPSVGIGAHNTVYLGYEGGDGHAMIAVSHDHGATWSPSFDAGAAFGIQNSQFPEVVAGDDDRAAYAFLGTPTAGNDQSSSFQGVWHLYVAFTYDGGAHWTTIDATPTDPVQRGCIWLNGGGNPCRNLLDFNDATVDALGRVLVGFADGCTSAKCVGPTGTPSDSRDALGTIARQNGGLGLFAAHDGQI